MVVEDVAALVITRENTQTTRSIGKTMVGSVDSGATAVAKVIAILILEGSADVLGASDTDMVLIALLGESVLKVAAFALAKPHVVVAVVEAHPGSFLGSVFAVRHKGELCGLEVLDPLDLILLVVTLVVLVVLSLLLGNLDSRVRVVLDGQQVVLQLNLPEVVPVAAIVQVRGLSLLVDNKGWVNRVGQIVRRPLVVISSHDQTAMVRPGTLSNVLS